MFTCKACMRRYLHGIIGDQFPSRVQQVSSASSRTVASFQQSRSQSNSYNSTKSNDTSEHHPSKRERWNETRASKPLGDTSHQKHGSFSRQAWLESRGKRPAGKERREAVSRPTARSAEPEFVPTTPRAMRKNLEFLQDPMKLAETVRHYLLENRYEQARELVEAASKDKLVIVSWNHIIDWQLSKGRIAAAIKTYNDMKKRAQVPDSHTFTILFRGLAGATEFGSSPMHIPTAAAKAISIYNSMLAENAPVRPNTIHMNAVLKVCARANDIDSMLGIAGGADNKIRAPNNMTYTIILNALRSAGQRSVDVASTVNLRRKMIHDARRIWNDIIHKWRAADIWIDEELICSMGRLLLLGDVKDVDDVFSLVEQTTNIPRTFPRLGTEERDRIEPSRQGRLKEISQCTTAVEPEIEPEDSETAEESGSAESIPAAIVDCFVSKSTDRQPQLSDNGYARPGRNILSLLAEASLALRIKAPMVAYWKQFTQELNIYPDGNNLIAYLRVLRVARASTEASDVIQAVFKSINKSILEKRHFRVAMAACERDKLNPSAFTNGSRILSIMRSTLPEQDLTVLHSFISLAVGASKHVKAIGEDPETKFAEGRQIRRALDLLGPSYLNIRSTLAYPDKQANDLTPMEKKNRDEYFTTAMSLTRTIVSAYDQLMNKGMVPREDYKLLMQHRSKYAAYITRAMDKKKRVQASSLPMSTPAPAAEVAESSAPEDADDAEGVDLGVVGERRNTSTNPAFKVNARARSSEQRSVSRARSGLDLLRQNKWVADEKRGTNDSPEAESTPSVFEDWKDVREGRERRS